MEDRVIRLEEQVKYHDKEIAEMKSLTTTLSKRMNSIDETLKELKYMIAGALLFAVLEQTGVVNAIVNIFK